MGLFDRILGAFGYTKASDHVNKQARVYQVPVMSGAETIGQSTPQNYMSYLKQYADAPWVYTCIYRIASKGSGVPWKLYKKKKKLNKISYDEVMSHPILDLLDKVNPFMTGSDLKEATLSYQELTGNSYWLLDAFVSGHPTEIYPLRPDRIRIIPSEKTYIKEYRYKISEGKEIRLKPEQVIQFKYFNSSDDFYGLSPLSAARLAVSTHDTGDKHNFNLLRNAAIPGGILHTDSDLPEENKKQIAHAWKTMHQGATNAGKLAILDGGLDWKAVGFTNKDMDYVMSKKMTREDILGVFGVPPACVGVFEYANYANAREQREIFWRDTMMPKLNKIANTINEFLVKPWDESLEVAFDYSEIDALQRDEEVRAKVDKTLIESGIKTINEAREERGLKPIEGGDIIRIAQNLVPADSSIAPEPEPKPTPAQEEPEPTPEERQLMSDEEVQEKIKNWNIKAKKLEEEDNRNKLKSILEDASNTFEEEDIINEQSFKEKNIDVELLKPMDESATFVVLNRNKEEIDQEAIAKEIRDKKWYKYKDLTEKWEEKMRPILQKEFKYQKDQTLLNLEDNWTKNYVNINIKDKDDERINRILFDKKEADKSMRKATKLIIEGSMADKAKQEIENMNLPISFNVSNPVVQEIISNQAIKLAYDVNTNTQDRIRDELKIALKNGEGINQAQKRIEHIFDVADKARTERISRTEILRATNSGAMFTYKEAGIEGKEWISTRDANVRDRHRIDGEKVNINEKFSNGLAQPGDPNGSADEVINCRCTIAGVIDYVSVKPVGDDWVASLSKAECSAINYWSEKGYRVIREIDKRGTANYSAGQVRKYNLFKSAINKSGNYKGIVYRGLHNLNINDYKEIFKAINIKFDATSSSTKYKNIAENFAGKSTNNVLMEIKTKSGIDISYASDYYREREVILRKDINYKVISKQETIDNDIHSLYMVLEEI